MTASKSNKHIELCEANMCSIRMQLKRQALELDCDSHMWLPEGQEWYFPSSWITDICYCCDCGQELRTNQNQISGFVMLVKSVCVLCVCVCVCVCVVSFLWIHPDICRCICLVIQKPNAYAFIMKTCNSYNDLSTLLLCWTFHFFCLKALKGAIKRPN